LKPLSIGLPVQANLSCLLGGYFWLQVRSASLLDPSSAKYPQSFSWQGSQAAPERGRRETCSRWWMGDRKRHGAV